MTRRSVIGFGLTFFLVSTLCTAAPDLVVLSQSVLDPTGDNDRFAEPSESFSLLVRLQNSGDESAVSISGTLSTAAPGVTILDATASFPDIPFGQKAETLPPHFQVRFDAGLPCAEPVTFTLRLDYFDSLSQPKQQTETFVLVVGEATVLFNDDFEYGVGGWDYDAVESTLPTPETDGKWIVANPSLTTYLGEPVQPEDDATEKGLSCYFTGQNLTSDPYTGDVDGGTSILKSRTYDLLGRGDVILAYARWFYTDTPDAGDELVAQISSDDGLSWVTIETVTIKQNRWTRKAYRVTDFIPLTGTVRVRFSATDGLNESLVEAAVDDVSFIEYRCEVDVAQPNLRLLSRVNDDGRDPTCTDLDGNPDGGETNEVTITVENTGTADGNNVNVTVSTTNPYVVWAGPRTKSFGAIPSNGGTASNTFLFTVDETAPCMEPARFDLAITATGPFSFADSYSEKLEMDRYLNIQRWFDDFDSGQPSWLSGLVDPLSNNWWAVQQEDCVFNADTVTRALNFLYQGMTGDQTDCSVSAYPANHNAYVYTPPIDTGVANPYLRTLRWEHLCTLGPGDYGEIYIDLDDDQVFDLLERLEGSVTGNDDILDPHEIDLQNSPTGLDVSTAGQRIAVLFLLYSDSIGGEGAYLGWIVDNVELEWSNTGPEQCDRYTCGGCVPPAFSLNAPAPKCFGAASSFSGNTINPGTGSFTYEWDFGDGTPAQPVTRAEDVLTHLYATPGSYLAMLTAVGSPDPTCRAEATTTARADRPPVLTASNNGPSCPGIPVSLQGSVGSTGTGPFTYSWSFGDGAPDQTVAAPTDVVTHPYAGPGPYTARLTAFDRDVAGCGSFGETVVQLQVPPTLQAANNGPRCAGGTVDLSATVVSAGSGTYTYRWSFGDGQPDQAVAAPTTVVPHNYSGPGPYTARLTATNVSVSGCGSWSETLVRTDTPPTLQAANNGPVCVGQPVDLTAAIVAPGSGTYTCLWSFGDGQPDQAVAAPTDVVSHAYSGMGPYTATLTATHASLAGCGSTSQTTVTIDPGNNPAGSLANALRVYKSGTDLKLDWRPSALTPRSYNVLRTKSRLQLADTLSGIGDETRIDAPVRSREQATDPAALQDSEMYYFEVWGANVCTGTTVF